MNSLDSLFEEHPWLRVAYDTDVYVNDAIRRMHAESPTPTREAILARVGMTLYAGVEHLKTELTNATLKSPAFCFPPTA